MARKNKARKIAAIALTSILIGACGSGGGGSQPVYGEDEVAARVAATMTAHDEQTQSQSCTGPSRIDYSRVQIADYYIVSAVDTLEIRSDPDIHSADNIIGRIPQGEEVIVTRTDPVCDGGLLLWEIMRKSMEPEQLRGWVPETSGEVDGEPHWLLSPIGEFQVGMQAGRADDEEVSVARPEDPYQEAYDRRRFKNITLALWSIINEAPLDWWEPKSEFETQAQYNERMREAEQDFLVASNKHFGEAEDFIYLIFAPGEGSRVSATTNYDGMVLHPYDPERNRYTIDIDGGVFTVNGPITLNWDVASLPNGVEFIDDIDYIDILVKDEENYFNTWCYPDVIRLHAQVPVDLAQQIRELDLEDGVSVQFFVKFDFPDNLRSYAWAPNEHLNLVQGRPVEPEPEPIVATMLRAEFFDLNLRGEFFDLNNTVDFVYFVWE